MLSHGLSENYSPWTQCSSCISVCLPSLGYGAEMGPELSELHLDIHRALLLYWHEADNVALCCIGCKFLHQFKSLTDLVKENFLPLKDAWLELFSAA